MPWPAESSSHARDFIAPGTLDVSGSSLGDSVSALHHGQTRLCRGLTRFDPSTVTREHLAKPSGSLLPRIAKAQICRSRRVPASTPKDRACAGPHPPPPNSRASDFQVSP